MRRSSSSSEHHFILLPVLITLCTLTPYVISFKSLWQCFIIHPTATVSFLSADWLMQHTHKHSQAMLAEMWRENASVHCWALHSLRLMRSSTTNKNIYFFHWSYRDLHTSAMSLIQPNPPNPPPFVGDQNRAN